MADPKDVSGDLLGQARPLDTSMSSLYSHGHNISWRGTSLMICNTSTSGATARVCHDESGTAFDETTAIFWDLPLLPGETLNLNLAIRGKSDAGVVSARSSVASALTFTLYGEHTT